MKIKKEAITWTLLIILLFTMIYKINKMEKNIISLKNNETLILLQLENEENNLKNINAKVVNIDNIIKKYSKIYGVEENLVKAVIKVESGGNQNARSSAGAIGLAQLTPATAKAMGVNPYTPDGNIKGATKYLAYLKEKFNGDTDLILASYNAGPNAVKKYNGVPPYKETKNYITKVKQEKAKLDEATRTTGTRTDNSTTVVRIH